MKEINTVLVSGGAGFIGSHLVDSLLSSGKKIICIDNFDPFYDIEIKRKNIESAIANHKYALIEGDIRNPDDLEHCFSGNNIDLVVHLAAKAGVRPSIEDPGGYFDVNVMGTLLLLEKMKKYGVNRMIFASSSSVYGYNPKVPFSETDNVDFPISPYAASKKACELLCHTYYHLFQFDIFCLRFFTVYGPRQRPDLAIHKFYNLIQGNKPVTVFGDGSSSRDYTYIDDIIDGVLRSIEFVQGFEIINLGESRTISLETMIGTIEKITNGKAIREYIPDQPGDVKITYADISKAKKLLGYLPKMNFDEGIKEFVRWKRQ